MNAWDFLLVAAGDAVEKHEVCGFPRVCLYHSSRRGKPMHGSGWCMTRVRKTASRTILYKEKPVNLEPQKHEFLRNLRRSG